MIGGVDVCEGVGDCGGGDEVGRVGLVGGGLLVGVGVVVGGRVVVAGGLVAGGLVAGGRAVVAGGGFGRRVRRGGAIVGGTLAVVGATLGVGVASVGGSDEGCPAAGGWTATPSPQVRSPGVSATGTPATVAEPVDTVTVPGSAAYQVRPVFLTSPLGRRTTSDSGRNAPLVLAVSTSSRPSSRPTVPCSAYWRPPSIRSGPTVVREPPHSTATDPPEKVSCPVAPGGTSIFEPSPT
jgi:hypothetical protein